MIVTRESPAPVRAIIKILVKETAHRAYFADRSEDLLRNATVPLTPTIEVLTRQADLDRARANTAMFLLACALLEASVDADGRWWASQEQAEREATELVSLSRAGRDLDEVFNESGSRSHARDPGRQVP